MGEKSRLLNFLHSFYRNEKGFTLIELLVVMVILGSLSGVATMNVGQFIHFLWTPLSKLADSKQFTTSYESKP